MVIATKTASQLAPKYEAVVIGTGYGGGVAASRLARMGLKVAVLEQGRLWRPGDFPTNAAAWRKAIRVTGKMPKVGKPTGLYSLSVGKGISVFAGTGIGGGSLINAGVVLRANYQRLRDAGWPEAVLSDGRLDEGYARAETMLGVAPVPEPERFGKYLGMRSAAEASGVPLDLPPMTIAHQPGQNAAGVFQYACRNCGDCWSGCNVGAKNTVGITYIVDAVDHGAEVFRLSRAEAIAKSDTGDGWRIEVKDLSGSGETRQVTAQTLVLAAGTLGTSEILLRAKDRGLALSPMLGEKFSANGDDLVFGTQLDRPIHAIAVGHPPKRRNAKPVGPHSMALINLGDEAKPVWVHDGTMLTLLAAMAPLKETMRLRLARAWRLLRGGVYGDEHRRTLVLYIVGLDDANGRLKLHKDRVYVDWPEFDDSPARLDAEAKAKDMIERMGGTFQPNPFALRLFGGNRVIAHPLGGCAMAETVDNGVIAPDGRVFDPSGGPAAVHDGLYVCDGAAVPTAIGSSPLLTIAALAERAMMLASERLGRPLDVTSTPPRPIRDAAM